MLRFCGFDLELLVDVVVIRREWPVICGARDEQAAGELIVQVKDEPADLAWLCAPVSERALLTVLAGQLARRRRAPQRYRHRRTGDRAGR